MRCLKASNPEDVDRVAAIINHPHGQEASRLAVKRILQEFDIVVPPDDEGYPPENED